MNSTEKLDLQVSESNDGSAVVSVVEPGFPNIDVDSNRQESSASSDNFDNGADNIPDIDPEREAIRVARREERSLKKQIHKAKASESNHLINALKRQNEQMADRLAVLEKRTAGSDLARIDKAIEDGHLKLQYAKLKIKEATEMANGAALADAQEQWYESRRQVEALEALKKKYGPPARSHSEKMKGLRSRFLVQYAEWDAKDYSVRFEGVITSVDWGRITLGTPKYFALRGNKPASKTAP
jgi:hypothetical protein